MPRRFEWGYETDTAMPSVLRPAHPQVVAADYLFELSQLPKLQEPGISSKRPWCAGSASRIAWSLHLFTTPSSNRILPRLDSERLVFVRDFATRVGSRAMS
jgi:hypothetical protein